MRAVESSPSIIVTLGQALCRTVIQQLKELSHRLRQVEGVQSVITRLDSCNCQQIVIYLRPGVEHSALLRRMATALRAPVETSSETTRVLPPESMTGILQPDAPRGCSIAISAVASTASQAGDGEWTVIRRLQEIGYGALAVASLGMAWVGLLVPGIPTVPFVILTVAFAAKASPALRQRLRQARVFGPMIRDWEHHRAIRRSARRKAIIVTVVLISITVLLAPPSVGLYVLIGTMSVISFALIMRIPVIADEEPTEADHAKPRLLPFSAVA